MMTLRNSVVRALIKQVHLGEMFVIKLSLGVSHGVIVDEVGSELVFRVKSLTASPRHLQKIVPDVLGVGGSQETVVEVRSRGPLEQIFLGMVLQS